MARQSGDPVTAQMGLLWAGLVSENSGDIAKSAAYAREGLTHPPLTPYLEGALHAQLSQLAMSVGDHDTAARHADVAIPILRRLHADDDARSLRLIAVMNTLLDGDTDTAASMLADLEGESADARLGSQMGLTAAWAELALARGDVPAGLRLFDEALMSVAPTEGLDFGGLRLSPWVLLAASGSLVARVRYGTTPADRRRAIELRDLLMEHYVDAALDGELPYPDFPLNGVLLAAVGVWAAERRGPRTCVTTASGSSRSRTGGPTTAASR